jgi:hypothetical protein
MFSKLSQVLLLSASLLMAGTASADQRDVLVPVIAEAAVGAVVATVISRSGHERAPQVYQGYAPTPRYQPVAYVPVAPRMDPRRFSPPPHRGYYQEYRGRHDRHDKHYKHGRGQGRGHDNGRW